MVRDGYFYGLGLLAVAILVHVLTRSLAWTAIPVLLALFFLWFFRNPPRRIPQGEGLVVSPADGKLTSIERVITPGGESVRLSIFLSVFDVHVNRAPIAGVFEDVRYQKGKFLNALNPESAVQNEQSLAVMRGDEGFDISFKQIAGLLARRIVFHPGIGDRVERGQLVGMIKFGSRVDIVLPAHATLRVAKGDRVKGGSTVLAEVKHRPIEDQPADEVVEIFA